VDRYEQFRGANQERMGPTVTGRGLLEAWGVDEAEPTADEEELNRADLAAQFRRVPAVREALDRMWPRLAPHELVHDLFGARPLLAASAEGVLSEAEQAMLARPRRRSLDEVAWTAADAAVVDAAREVRGA